MTTKSSIRATAVEISLAASLLLPSAIAHAGVITIYEDTLEQIGYTDTTGRVTTSTCTLNGFAAGDSCIITFTPPDTPEGSSATQSRINIFEDASLTVLSDTLEITESQGLFTATFLSDVAGGLTALPEPARSLVETGTVQNAFTITWFGPNFSVIDVDTIDFVSDVDTVPEPATLALFGIGLAGLGAMRRKQRA